MEAYTGGISTRKVDALVEALGGDSGISKSEVSRICQGLDEQVKAFLGRPLDHAHFPYVYLDATYLHRPGRGWLTFRCRKWSHCILKTVDRVGCCLS